MNVSYLANLSLYIPELLCIATMVGLLFLEAVRDEREGGMKTFFVCAYAGLIFSLISLFKNLELTPTGIFTNALVIDPFSTFLKILMVMGTMASIYLSNSSQDIYSYLKGEFTIISIGVLIGGMLLVSANNLLTTFLGIETLSILSYVMASLKKDDDRSSEAGVKYALYGAVASGLMLFGMSHIFGVFGTVQFAQMYSGLNNLTSVQTAVLIPAFVFFFVGLGYKIAAVPFHMWSPDVYEGSPIPVTAFFALIPKMAGLAIIIRVTMIFFGEGNSLLQISWLSLIQVVAALTMIVGNIAAIGQRSVKRMLAYSSIGHAGFMLLGVAVVDQIGVSSILFYLVAYLFMTLVAFFITSFVNDEYGNDHFERFNGLAFKYPLMAIVMTICMFSLTGLPPLAGFVAKFNIFYAALNKKLYTLVLIGAITSVVSLYFYAKIVRYMFFNPVESDAPIGGFKFMNQTLIISLALPILFLGIFWSGLFSQILNIKLFFVK